MDLLKARYSVRRAELEVQRNELLSVTDPEGETTGFEYDSLGREVRRSLGNGVVTRTAYDPAGRVKAITNEAPRGWGHDKEFSPTIDRLTSSIGTSCHLLKSCFQVSYGQESSSSVHLTSERRV